MRLLRLGQIYRYSRPYRESPAIIDGLPNFFAAVELQGKHPKLLLDAGINSPKPIRAPEGERRSSILISSSPHKIGSAGTPWADVFQPNLGRVLYYGDNRDPEAKAEEVRGNSILLSELKIHNSPSKKVRESATPIFIFRRVPVDARNKGNVRFEGLAVVEAATRITQTSPATGQVFTNYAFDLAILKLDQGRNLVDWGWIAARQNSKTTLESSLELAPSSWKSWITSGMSSLPDIRGCQ